LKTFIENLTTELNLIRDKMFELLDNSRIYVSRRGHDSRVVVVAPQYYWENPNEIEQKIQTEIKKIYNPWIETFKLLIENSPSKSKKEIDRIDKFINDWIEKKQDWGIPSTIPDAKKKFEKELKLFYDTLALYSSTGDKQTILIPDTNAIISQPEPKSYKSIVGIENITIVFLPTVLSELDELKIKSSNPEFQKKVKSVITRLKGYRQQGNMLNGITVEKSICLKMIAAEPNFGTMLTWLDKDNNDDRIIASAIEIQRDNPSSTVCIITGDINLQNKAEMAKLSYFDIE